MKLEVLNKIKLEVLNENKLKLRVFDKDGTIVCPASGQKFVQHPQDQLLMPGAFEGIQKLQENGHVIAIASNQGGVAAGHKTMQEAIEEMDFCISLLPPGSISYAIFAPSYEEEGGECMICKDGKWLKTEDPIQRFRKPNAGMILSAIAECGVSHTKTVMIGDRDEDSQAAEAAGVRFIEATKWRSAK